MVILNLKHVWQVATKGAQQKLNDKDMEEKEKLWQESFGKQIKFTFFPPQKMDFYRFAHLPLQTYDLGGDWRGKNQNKRQEASKLNLPLKICRIIWSPPTDTRLDIVPPFFFLNLILFTVGANKPYCSYVPKSSVWHRRVGWISDFNLFFAQDPSEILKERKWSAVKSSKIKSSACKNLNHLKTELYAW